MEETAGRATKRNLRRSRLLYLMQITGLEKPTPLAALSIPAMACLREIALQTPMDKLKDEYGMPNVKGEMV